MRSIPTKAVLNDIFARRNRYTVEDTAAKLDGLAQIETRAIRSPSELRVLHRVLCFLRAYPDNRRVYEAADRGLAAFAARVAGLSDASQERLAGSGVAGTDVSMAFGYDAAEWLSRAFASHIDIDWGGCDSTAAIDNLISHFLLHAELQSFEDTELSTKAWLRTARGGAGASDLEWLLRQLDRAIASHRTRRELYEAAEVPLVWRLGDDAGSITNNRVAVREICFHGRGGIRPFEGHAAREIARPIRTLRRVNRREGKRLILTAVMMLGARSREVYSFSHGNADEVYLSDVGRGTQIAVNGVLPDVRLSLEGNFGYMMLKNGVPVGYGGVSPLFLQGNTGINIFEPYRGGESSWLWVQTLRTFHALFGCTRFVINPYQFGADNREAIDSGAFWFYYRLGFRPAEAETRKLAADEWRRLSADRKHRTPANVLRGLTKSDLHLTLPGAKQSEFFDERWLTRCGEGVTRLVAAEGLMDRAAAVRGIAARVARALGVRNRSRWPAAERRAFDSLAPFAALIDDLASWPTADKRGLVSLLRAKGRPHEREFIERLRAHARFRVGLAGTARRKT